MKGLKEKVFVLYLQKTKKQVEELGVFSEKEDAEEAKLEESFEYGSDKLFIKEEFRKKSLREIELEGDILDAIIENGGNEEKKDEEVKVTEEVKEVTTVVVVTPPQPVIPIPVSVVTSTTSKVVDSTEEQLRNVVKKKKPMSTTSKIVCIGLGCIVVAAVATALRD